MKYAIRIITIICGVSLLTSCQKTYTCYCTFHTGTYPGSVSEDFKGSKNSAQNKCSTKAEQLTFQGAQDAKCGIAD